MAVSEKHSKWFIVFSVMKQVVGIVVMSLTKVRSPQFDLLPWLLGFSFLITACVGFVAGYNKNRAVVGFYMALNIISMVVTVIVVVNSMSGIGPMFIMPHPLNLLLILLAIPGWCLCLAASITSCSACCCCYSQTITPNVVYVYSGDYGFLVGAKPPINCIMPGLIEQAKEVAVKDNYKYSRMP